MRYVQPAQVFTVTFWGYATGLVGTAGVQIDGDTDGTRVHTGIVEDPSGSGVYVCTLTAPTGSGVYRVTFDDGSEHFSVEDLTVNASGVAPIQPASYTPTVAQLASILRLRTYYQSQALGTFTDDTQPTAAQVADIIDLAATELYGTFGPDVPAALLGSALAVVKYYAAMQVEISFFADQIGTPRSPYAQLETLYENAFNAFVKRRKDLGSETNPGEIDDSDSGLANWIEQPLGDPRIGRPIW